ncbi:MAG: linear amide C-N hydrolase, partial [Clostridiales bacterium]|nr:linear amide C-N hydrolase [Clostridiales bacterium]
VYRGEEDSAVVILENMNFDYYNISRFLLNPDENGNVALTVSVEECPEDKRQKVVQYLNERNLSVYEFIKEEGNADAAALEYFEFMCSDEGQSLVDDSVSRYQCKVENTGNAKFKVIGEVLAVAGSVIALVSLLLIKLSPKVIILGTLVLMFAGVITLVVVYRNRISTFASLKEHEPGVYAMNCKEDYKLQAMLDAGISNEGELLSAISDEMFWGMPLNVSGMSFGCSSFAVTAPDGHHLMGRNYDYPETDLLMIYSDPEDGYASIGMADIGLMGLGTDEGETDPLSAGSRFMSVAFPYLTVDGINEAGVGISILQLEHEEIHQDTGKPDILMNVAIRAILDTCGSTDEALALLNSYDMHSMIDRSFHLFITDRSGRSVIVEWIDNEMAVTEDGKVTNHILCSGYTEGDPDTDSMNRYKILTDNLSSCGGTADAATAMIFLSDAALRSDDPGRMQTEWSCVYDLDDFKVTICTDAVYDHSFTVTPETF